MICSGFLTANHMLFTQRLDLISRPDAKAAAGGVKITCARCSCFIHSKLCLLSFCDLSCSDIEHWLQLKAVLHGGSPSPLRSLTAAHHSLRKHFMKYTGWIISKISFYSACEFVSSSPFSSACPCTFLSKLKTNIKSKSSKITSILKYHRLLCFATQQQSSNSPMTEGSNFKWNDLNIISIF